MNVFRVSVLIVMLLTIGLPSKMIAQVVEGVNLLEYSDQKKKVSNFYAHYGYLNSGLSDRRHQYLFKIGYKGFQWNRWRIGLAMGFGNFAESLTGSVRLTHTTFDKVHFFVEPAISIAVDGIGKVPSVGAGIMINDTYELHSGIMWTGRNNRSTPYLGVGFNTDAWKKSILGQGSATLVLIYLALKAIGNSR